MTAFTPNELVEKLLAVPGLPFAAQEDLKELQVALARVPPKDFKSGLFAVQEVFNTHVPKVPVEDWHFEAIAVFTQTPIELVRAQSSGKNQ